MSLLGLYSTHEYIGIIQHIGVCWNYTVHRSILGLYSIQEFVGIIQ